MSPWWLRPPGEESDEPETVRGKKENDRPAEDGVPSIADLVGGRAAIAAEAEAEAAAEARALELEAEAAAPLLPARETGGFFAPRRALEVHAVADEVADLDAIDAAGDGYPNEAGEIGEASDASDSR